MNEPLRHHFLPVFFLKNWAGADGRLVEFSKPYGKVVKPKFVHPKATGFINRLYAIEGLPGELSYEVEKSFLSPVDSRAATAMKALLAGARPTTAERDAWARFVMSLLMRMPAEITLLKNLVNSIDRGMSQGVGHMVLRHTPEEYHGDIVSAFDEYMQDARHRLTNTVIKVLSSDDIVPLISAMHWDVIDFTNSPHELLVSDRPVVVHKRAAVGTTIALPVGPRKLFVGATNPVLLRMLRGADPKKTAASINIEITAGASRLVFGSSDRQISFVQNRMGTNKRPSFVADILSDVGVDANNLAETIASFEDDELRKQILVAIAEHKSQRPSTPFEIKLSTNSKTPGPIKVNAATGKIVVITE